MPLLQHLWSTKAIIKKRRISSPLTWSQTPLTYRSHIQGQCAHERISAGCPWRPHDRSCERRSVTCARGALGTHWELVVQWWSQSEGAREKQQGGGRVRGREGGREGGRGGGRKGERKGGREWEREGGSESTSPDRAQMSRVFWHIFTHTHIHTNTYTLQSIHVMVYPLYAIIVTHIHTHIHSHTCYNTQPLCHHSSDPKKKPCKIGASRVHFRFLVKLPGTWSRRKGISESDDWLSNGTFLTLSLPLSFPKKKKINSKLERPVFIFDFWWNHQGLGLDAKGFPNLCLYWDPTNDWFSNETFLTLSLPLSLSLSLFLSLPLSLSLSLSLSPQWSVISQKSAPEFWLMLFLLLREELSSSFAGSSMCSKIFYTWNLVASWLLWNFIMTQCPATRTYALAFVSSLRSHRDAAPCICGHQISLLLWDFPSTVTIRKCVVFKFGREGYWRYVACLHPRPRQWQLIWVWR